MRASTWSRASTCSTIAPWSTSAWPSRSFGACSVRGGYALIRIPAFDWLRGAHDVVIHTERRFTVGQLAGRMRDAGFQIAYASYANSLLFPLALAKRVLDRYVPSSPTDLTVPPKAVNALFEAALTLEAPIAHRFGLPIGLSTVVLGRA